MDESDHRWLRWLTERAGGCRLICFHYAGGSVHAFRGLAGELHPAAELVAVQLPGREERIDEAPYERMGPLLDQLERVLAPLSDQPFVFFGYSMGARVGLALTQRLAEHSERVPEALFVAASPGPVLPIPVPGWDLPDDGLLEYLRDVGGTPAAMLADEELVRLLLPTARADLTVVATWPYVPRPVPCSVYALAGADDPYASPERMRAWERETTGSFTCHTVAGGHFFLKSSPAEVAGLLNAVLTRGS
ncbi:thioesterase, partial [Nonomuraea sp. RK-328]|nr:thioesterase [Nonomuraea sp. RK-328]